MQLQPSPSPLPKRQLEFNAIKQRMDDQYRRLEDYKILPLGYVDGLNLDELKALDKSLFFTKLKSLGASDRFIDDARSEISRLGLSPSRRSDLLESAVRDFCKKIDYLYGCGHSRLKSLTKALYNPNDAEMVRTLDYLYNCDASGPVWLTTDYNPNDVKMIILHETLSREYGSDFASNFAPARSLDELDVIHKNLFITKLETMTTNGDFIKQATVAVVTSPFTQKLRMDLESAARGA